MRRKGRRQETLRKIIKDSLDIELHFVMRLVAVGEGRKTYFLRIFFSLLYAHIFSVILAFESKE